MAAGADYLLPCGLNLSLQAVICTRQAVIYCFGSELIPPIHLNASNNRAYKPFYKGLLARYHGWIRVQIFNIRMNTAGLEPVSSAVSNQNPFSEMGSNHIPHHLPWPKMTVFIVRATIIMSIKKDMFLI